jgi:acetyl esterase/lipase
MQRRLTSDLARVACALVTLTGAAASQAQPVRVETIIPTVTDPAISAWNTPHVAAFEPLADQRGQLFIFLHGQGGAPANATELIKAAARLGYHAIGLSYPNDWSPFILCNASTDPNCAENLRREILEGINYSPLITVPRADSVENRVAKLIAHLDARHPTEGWGAFLDQAGDVRWDLVAVWGHSQGGGNAGVLARHNTLARVCLSAPAADGGAFSPAPWWAQHQTPSSAYFGLCHTQDALANKVAFWNGLGMDAFGPVIDVATAAPPFNGTHTLSSSIAPAVTGQFHNSVAIDSVTPRLADGTPVYTPVWEYMLTAPTDAAPSVAPSLNDAVFATVPTFDGETDLMLDVYGALTGTGPRPVVVWIHGGGWQNGSHNQISPFILDLRRQGITVASIGYRLSGQASFPAQIHDCKGAIRWLRANAEELLIDPARIAVWGGSAGGHLACLVATSGNEPGLEGSVGGNTEFDSSVLAAVVYFGPSDLLQTQPDCEAQPVGCTVNHDEPTSGESKLLGVDQPGQGIGWLRENLNNPLPPFPELAQRAANANPITHLDPSDPPLYLVHGDLDTTVALNQSLRVRDAAEAVGVPVTFVLAEGFGHGFLGTQANTQASAWIADQVLNVSPCPRCAADFDANGGVDGGDLAAFFLAFEAGSSCADIDRNGGVDGDDVAAFFNVFEAGGC